MFYITHQFGNRLSMYLPRFETGTSPVAIVITSAILLGIPGRHFYFFVRTLFLLSPSNTNTNKNSKNYYMLYSYEYT
jgi:hypothetical protein